MLILKLFIAIPAMAFILMAVAGAAIVTGFIAWILLYIPMSFMGLV